VPVLLEGATLPDAAELPADLRKLAGRQAMELSDARWRGDLQRLIDSLRKLPGFDTPPLPPDPVPTPVPIPTPVNRKKWWWGIAAAVMVGTIVTALDQPDPPYYPERPQGLPSGAGVQVCSCLSPDAPMAAPAPQCASGQVRANQCSGVCPTGLPPLAYVCM
jgi:hypothetical protein